jgi:hypothetical protein
LGLRWIRIKNVPSGEQTFSFDAHIFLLFFYHFILPFVENKWLTQQQTMSLFYYKTVIIKGRPL